MLRFKYISDNSVNFALSRSYALSPLWQGMHKVADVTLSAISWCVGNGRKIKFWTDMWLDNNGPLVENLIPYTDGIMDSAPIASFVNDGCWDTRKFAHILPEAIVNKILAHQVPFAQADEDMPFWTLTSTGKFNLSSAIDLLNSDTLKVNNNNNWSRVLKWSGPQRVKSFLWLALQDRLLTNHERNRRHLVLDPIF